MNAATAIHRETNAVNSLNDALWSVSQQSRVLQDLRRDIRIVWDDEAAREINGRYLNSHETDDLSMREEMKEQAELLSEAGIKLEAASEFGKQVEDFSKIVSERMQFARQDLDNAYNNYDLFVQYNSDARSKFPIIQQFIDRANASCE
jgi:hypothetical protein